VSCATLTAVPLRTQAGRSGNKKSFVALVADNKRHLVEPQATAKDSDFTRLLHPLAAVAPQEHAALFTVVTADTLADKVQKAAVWKALIEDPDHAAARLSGSRLVTLRIEGPLVDNHGKVVKPETAESKELQLVAMPMSSAEYYQLFFMNPTHQTGSRGWVTAAADGRGMLQEKRKTVPPSGWECFDVVFSDDYEGDDAGADEAGEPVGKRQRKEE
jgi:hypothetical protein